MMMYDKALLTICGLTLCLTAAVGCGSTPKPTAESSSAATAVTTTTAPLGPSNPDDPCAKSPVLCESSGMCTTKKGADPARAAELGDCVAGSNQDCLQSMGCQLSGFCTAKDGFCVLASDADCEKSSQCRGGGLCSMVVGTDGPNRCQATKESCEKSDVCRDENYCDMVDGHCRNLALTDADCRKNQYCERTGTCGAREGRCVAVTAADCEASSNCKKRGYCSVVAGSCERSNDADCARTPECKERGECRFQDGSCVDPKSLEVRSDDGRVRMGMLSVSGPLPPEVIRRIVGQNVARFALCYEKGLQNNPNLQGRVSVRFVIGRDGSVSNVSGDGDLADGGVVSCVTRAFYELSFPQTEGGIVTVSYPIVFTPGG